MSLSDAYFDQVSFFLKTIGNCNWLCYNGSKHGYEEGLVSNSWYILFFTMLVTLDAYKVSSFLSYSALSFDYCFLLLRHKYNILVFLNYHLHLLFERPCLPLQGRFHFCTFPSSHLLFFPKITHHFLSPCTDVSSITLNEVFDNVPSSSSFSNPSGETSLLLRRRILFQKI